jgi:ORF6N domain
MEYRSEQMAKKATTKTVSLTQIEGVTHIVRGQRVMLDSDLAELYGVPTKALNQAVTRNAERFPDDFAYQLTEQEFADLRSQIVTSKPGSGGRRYAPTVFTEHGVAMLSSVLRSPTAVRVNIEIMLAFVRLRRLLATPGELVAQINQLAETVKLHDHQIKAIADVLKRMMEPPAQTTPKRRIGFGATESPKSE